MQRRSRDPNRATTRGWETAPTSPDFLSRYVLAFTGGRTPFALWTGRVICGIIEMMIEAFSPESLIVVVVFVSAVAGGLLMWLAGYINRSIGGGSSARREHDLSIAAAAWAEAEAPVPTPAPAGEQQLLRVSRTDEGELTVFVQGQPCNRLRDISDPRAGREAIEALQATLAFAEGWVPFIQKELTEPAVSTEPTGPQERRPRQPLRPVRPAADSASATVVKPGVREPGSMLDPLTMVEEIDALVQRRLKERPDLADRLITLTIGLGEGLRIYMDQQVFQTVDEIDDPHVRALIQDAIREWESS
jgi:hypothetical protein